MRERGIGMSARANELRRDGGILAPRSPRPISRAQRPPPQLRRRLTAAAVAVALGAGTGNCRTAHPPHPAPLRSRCRISATRRRRTSRRRRNASSARRSSASSARAAAYINDPEVNDYLNELGHRLVAASKDVKQDFEFFGVPDPQINAFALPGGYIGVQHRADPAHADASPSSPRVLAHEITHVTQHHMARALSAQKDSMLMSLAGLALAILAARGGGSSSGEAASAAIAATQALTIQNQINFTRENEYEADRIGFQRLDAAGFDVTAMATFMERMQRAFRFAEGNAPTYLRTHPITYERIAEAQARAQGHPYRQVAVVARLPPRARAAAQLPGRAEGSGRVLRRLARRAQVQQRDRHALRSRRVAVARARITRARRSELATLEKIAPEHPMIDAMAGHVLLDSGDLQGAIKRFEAGVARYPNKMQLVYDYPEALLQAGRDADAARFVERQLARFPDDGPLQLARRARLRGAEQADARAPAPGRVLRVAGQSERRDRAVRDRVEAEGRRLLQASVVDTRLKALKKRSGGPGQVGVRQFGLALHAGDPRCIRRRQHRHHDRDPALELRQARIIGTHRLHLAAALPVTTTAPPRAFIGLEGDLLDAIVLGPRRPYGATVRTRAWGAVTLTDRGMSDDKLICSEHPVRWRSASASSGSFVSTRAARACSTLAPSAGPQCVRRLVRSRGRHRPRHAENASVGPGRAFTSEVDRCCQICQL